MKKFVLRISGRSQPSFFRRPRNLGIFATIAAALWGARRWQANR
jgi:hypothetical protein